ncbi:hypothetical protein [Psychrobacillus sp. BM2]|uniref:hypothetical protein n=1 Tax=Psychrobacillus sp. BM2 TaxID=3400421 RepID=UPI003B010539
MTQPIVAKEAQTFVSYTFTATTSLTPEQVKNFFNYMTLATHEFNLKNEFGAETVLKEVELHLNDAEWIDEEKQWEDEEAAQ